MYQLLFSATIDASGGYGRVESVLEGPYCFGGYRSFSIHNIEKDAKFAIRSVHRRFISRYPNLIAESLYSEKLLGPMGGHVSMQHMLATPEVLAGTILKVNYPWNYTDYADNCVLLIHYRKEFGQPGPYPPACVKVLGRALTAVEKLLLQDQLGVDESNIQGNGINGCGKCWYANSNDDDVYTFTIPPSVMLKGAQDVDYVTIDGAEVKLDTIEGGLKINCKDLMNNVTMNFNHAADLAAAMDREGYLQKAVS
eukprot:gene12387-14336_t